MTTPQERPQNGAHTRDEDMKPGTPPRPATEPAGGEDSAQNAKTMTDPATGEPMKRPPAPS